jgi:hypothetical protein
MLHCDRGAAAVAPNPRDADYTLMWIASGLPTLRTQFLQLASSHASDYTGSTIHVCGWGVERPVGSGPREAGSRPAPAPALLTSTSRRAQRSITVRTARRILRVEKRNRVSRFSVNVRRGFGKRLRMTTPAARRRDEWAPSPIVVLRPCAFSGCNCAPYFPPELSFGAAETPAADGLTGRSTGAPLSLTKNTMNFAGLVLLAFRPTV